MSNLVNLKPPTVTIWEYSGKPIDLLGEAFVKVKMNGNVKMVRLFRVKGKAESIYGEDFLKKLSQPDFTVNHIIQEKEVSFILKESSVPVFHKPRCLW